MRECLGKPAGLFFIKGVMAQLCVRAQQERELKLHREHLEWMVKERTAELERKTLELDRQHRKMQELANTDSLTGACSRRHLLNLFQHELQRARRSGEPLAVLMLDVDHFKRVNDRHGHVTGDRVLTLLVRTCRDELRAIDVIGRLGGEEFAIVLPQASQAKAMTAAERLRAALAALSLQNDQGESFGFTVSIGVSQMLGADDDDTAILARADQQLYRAKRQGHNRVCAKHTCHD